MLKIKTVEEFRNEINEIRRMEGDGIIDSICIFAAKYELEYEKLVPYINATFKSQILLEAESRHMIKGEKDGNSLIGLRE